ncbi:30S ribosome-binding factor RbfA [Candidatus Parcubacteria bacterium]|nr:30S ribosome-binding factor RbfA [Candidatus Parcubacteria bacterium]
MTKRVSQVNELVRRKLSRIIFEEIDFPGVLVTITRVETSERLNQAQVYVGVMPDNQSEKVFRVLRKLVYGLQQKLNKSLAFRSVPRIRFIEEKEVVRAAKIDELLEKIKKE